MLRRIAQTGKPVLLSSGMSSWKELDRAVDTLKAGKGKLTVMQCSSAYPCPPEQVGLNVMLEMKARYGVDVGFSDHTMGYAAPLAAASLGATVIEKHFTFSRLMYGSDAKHSMEPAEFKILSQSLKEIWAMLKNPVNKADVSQYEGMKAIFEKSVVTACPVAEGTVFEWKHLAFKKPGTGISAAEAERLLGKRATHSLPKDHLLKEEDFR
jgi:N-acetylneuraminate synthase